MLIDLVQLFLRATVSLELGELSTNWHFLLRTLQTVRFGFSQVRPRRYLYFTDWRLVFLNSLYL